jgi:hypothetical protein
LSDIKNAVLFNQSHSKVLEKLWVCDYDFSEQDKIDIHDLHRRIDDIKDILLDLELMIYNANKFSVINEHFKFQKGATTRKITAKNLLSLFPQYGIIPEALSLIASDITTKKASELLGLSESAFLECHGDLVEEKENKPTLKRTW